MTEKVTIWLTPLTSFGAPKVDALDAGEGWGIFPRGSRPVSQREDILGERTQVRRYAFRIKVHLMKDPREGDGRGAAFFETLAGYARSAPWRRAWVENAHLAAQSGAMARYEAELYIEIEE